MLWTCGVFVFDPLPATVTSVHAAEAAEFVSLFDGKTLNGWHVSSKTGHSRASGQQSGGRWVVENGAIVGSQDIPGNGGILLTDSLFGDFEVSLEMNNDYGPDSGLFLRSSEDGKAWQAMIDYHSGGNLMGIYGEGLGGKPSVRNFTFLEKVTDIREDLAPVKLPVLPDAWPAFWRHGTWNELRARITGNPPLIRTWINGVKMMEWQETQVRHSGSGAIAVQVHGGGDFTKQFVRYRNIRARALDLAENELSSAERAAGWLLLFDGKTHAGWMNSDKSVPRSPVSDGTLNPHKSGHYMLVHSQPWSNFMLRLEFKLSPGCNSGVFFRTHSLEPRPGKDVGFNGLEVALDDTHSAGYHDTGAIYDLVKPSRNAMRPVGDWNQLELVCDGPLVSVKINDELVTQLDLNQFRQAFQRPDGSKHKFDVAFKDHPLLGYIGLQDHGSACWYRNIKLKPL